jgi:hypothetical protein
VRRRKKWSTAKLPNEKNVYVPVVAEQGITGLRRLNEVLIGGNHVAAGRRLVFTVIHENSDVLVFESVHIFDVFEHVVN